MLLILYSGVFEKAGGFFLTLEMSIYLKPRGLCQRLDLQIGFKQMVSYFKSLSRLCSER